jgi:lysophospholipase L1-like esterase
MHNVNLDLVFLDGSTPVVKRQVDQTLSVTRGEDVTVKLSCYNEDGSRRNLAGHTLVLGATSDPFGKKPLTGFPRSATVSDATGGAASVVMTDVDIDTYGGNGFFVSVWANDGASDWQPMIQGRVRVAGTSALPTTPPVIVGVALTSLTLTPTAITATVTQSQQFTATGHYSDGSTLNLTSAVTWSTNNTALSTVTNGNAGGLFSIGAGGDITLTAALGAVSASKSTHIDPLPYARLNALKIMPFGDSATYGNPVDGGAYRVWLWNDHFVPTGVVPNFVGLQSSGPENLPDKDHEGRSGFTIGPLGLGWNPDYIPLIFNYNQPDLILMLIGGNDCGQNLDIPNAGARLAALLDATKLALPNVFVILSTVTGQADTAANDKVTTFNAQLPAVVAARSSWMLLVDNHARIDRTTDLLDGIHLLPAGNQKLSDGFWAGIQQWLARP